MVSGEYYAITFTKEATRYEVRIKVYSFRGFGRGSGCGRRCGIQTFVVRDARAFTVTDAKGRNVTLSESFGRPVILNFWATWCPPCRSELPAFEKLYRKYQAKVTFMMIDLSDGYRETPDSVKKFLSENGYTFPVYYDSEGSAAKAYNALSIPFTVAIDKNGNVKKTHLGAMSEAALESIIKSLIEAK